MRGRAGCCGENIQECYSDEVRGGLWSLCSILGPASPAPEEGLWPQAACPQDHMKAGGNSVRSPRLARTRQVASCLINCFKAETLRETGALESPLQPPIFTSSRKGFRRGAQSSRLDFIRQDGKGKGVVSREREASPRRTGTACPCCPPVLLGFQGSFQNLACVYLLTFD